jgi:nucleotide-binding universal stress UspA family protein
VKERSIDEFESIFERASIPVLDIEEVAINRISAVLKGEPLDDSVLVLAAYLKQRFEAQVDLHYPAMCDGEPVLKAARKRGLHPQTQPFVSTAELVGQVSIGRARLVLMAEPVEEEARFVDIDAMVQGTAPPVLIIRQPIDKPSDVFAHVLHSLTGNFQQTQNFSYSFTLVKDRGTIELLHTIDESDIEDVKQALRMSLEVDAYEAKELLESLARHAERYLKGVAAASHKRPFNVSYTLAVGEVVPTVQAALAGGKYTLLVVGSHEEGHSRVRTSDYQLMHTVREIPVLAL